jgi:hypothetical protein
MQDTKKIHDSQFRSVLKRLSPVLQRHSEFISFCEERKNHDALHIVVSNGKICKVYNNSKT